MLERPDDERLLPNIFGTMEKQIKCYKQSFQVNLYDFYIIDEIREPMEYVDFFNILKNAESHDVITIHLNCDGGSLRTAIQMITAMKNTAATVVTSIEGSIASAATLIFLSGKKFIVNQNSAFMVHSYSGGFMGKSNEIAAKIMFTEKYFKDLCNSIYGGFLTPKELADVFEGKDLWFDSEQIVTRLTRKFKNNDAIEIIKT